MGREWFKITAKDNRAADINIYEQIGIDWLDGSGVVAKKFIEGLNSLDVDEINLYINSPGGDVFDGTAIYNALKRHKAKINVKIDGIAASIASVIAMAGDTIEMPENALMMIHDPSGAVWGTSEDMLKMAETLEKVKAGFVTAYRNKSGMEDKEISKLMTAETWFTAREAIDSGLADIMTDRVNLQANFSVLSRFKNMPSCLKNRPVISGIFNDTKSKEGSSLKSLEEKWNFDFAQNKTLQAEFGNLERYISFMRVEEAGEVTIIRGKVVSI